MITAKAQGAIQKVADGLGIPFQWLFDLIRHESGGEPQAKNPYSSARGLIQFTDSTAQALGYKSSLDLVEKNKTAEKQILGPVKKYLAKFAPFPSEQSLYMSVFFPAYRNVSPQTYFPANVRAVNPGINTPQDYINKVKGIAGAAAAGIIPAMIAAGIGFYLYRRFAK